MLEIGIIIIYFLFISIMIGEGFFLKNRTVSHS